MAAYPIGESEHPTVRIGSVLVPLTDRSAIAASCEVEPPLLGHHGRSSPSDRPGVNAESAKAWLDLARGTEDERF
jgi:hypothetical protein